MSTTEATPPPLPSSAGTRPGVRAACALILLLGSMMLARVVLHSQLPLPACPLRELTGVPCPLCGGTRAFASLAGLDFGEALRLNPLVSLAAVGAGVLWTLALLRRDGGWTKLNQSPGGRAVWKWLLALALLLNWLYLWFRLPR